MRSSGGNDTRTEGTATPPRNQGEELFNNILPSYQFFQSTISKNLTPSSENFEIDPPMYEMTPVQSTATTPSCMISASQSPVDDTGVLGSFPFPQQPNHTFTEESADMWENTILANAHKLPNLSNTNNSVNNNLKVKISVTEKVCQKGEEPKIINPSCIEFQQGDFIHGFVTIKNESDVPIPFDMVYVVFEGTITVLENNRGLIDTQNPHTVYPFLSMIDLFASWSFANIDRLVTDNGDPHDWCDGETDPFDDTVLSIDVKRQFQPGVTYKRFFTFRVPEKLLDDACEIHSLTRHTEVPPSMGIRRKSTSPLMILANKDSQIRDLCFVDTDMSYSVDARVIGRASAYGVETARDQYVIAQETACPVRVIPKSNPELYYNRSSNLNESSAFYKAFVDSVKAKLEYANDLLNVPASQRFDFVALSPASSRESSNSETTKLRQLYDAAGSTIQSNLRKNRKQFQDNVYQCLVPYKKKSLTGTSKVLGIVSLSTPKEEYRTFYVPPVRFRDEEFNSTKHDFTITIPIELSYFIENAVGLAKVPLPEVKSLNVDLVVFTARSRKHFIPVEINHDLCFRDQEIDSKKKEFDNFDSIVVKQFQDYLQQANRVLQNLDNELIKFETQMFKDIKCLASLQCKHMALPIMENGLQFFTKSSTGSGSHISMKTIPWESETQDGSPKINHALYSKKFEVKIDLSKCSLKGSENKNISGFDQLTLVPSFQTCHMARLYYFKITAKLSNGDFLVVNAPLNIERL